MMRIRITLLISALLVGILVGVISTILVSGLDVLSIKKENVIALKSDLILSGDKKNKLTLPKGTKLIHKSQYDDVGVFYLNVIIDDLSLIENSTGDTKYFIE